MASGASAHQTLMRSLFPAIREAGAVALQIHARGCSSEMKGDGSPVTEADRAVETILLSALAEHAPGVAVVSEENAESHSLNAPDRFFLVDPIDGTKEFLKADGSGAFTINVALIEAGHPVMGIVFAPALDQLFAGVVGEGAALSEGGRTRVITVRDVPADGPVALTSVSHKDEATARWLADHGIEKTRSVGSSLKLCLLAKGEADLYPRVASVMEWDVAAGDAVLRAAGGSMVTMDGAPFSYGTDGFRTGPFIASGRWKPQMS